MKLSRGDLRVLRYIKRRGPVSFRRCVKRFGAESKIRLDRLFDQKLIENDYKEGMFSASKGLVITSAGKVAFKDAREPDVFARVTGVLALLISLGLLVLRVIELF